MRRLIFNNVKRMIPKISDTEKIALNCGTTSIDRELFEGKVKDHKFELSEKILDESLKRNIDYLLDKHGNNQQVYPFKTPESLSLFYDLGKNGFFFVFNSRKI